MSESMFRVYESYSRDPRVSLTTGNTVRSFTSATVTSGDRESFQFDLSSLPDSELILSATFHFLLQRLRPQQKELKLRTWRLQKPRRSPEPHAPQTHPSPRFLFRGSSSSSDFSTPLGNITLSPLRRGSWQTRDVTALLKQARATEKLLIIAELQTGHQPPSVSQQGSSHSAPYLLVYIDDRAIDEPNSVALTLQRYGPSAEDSSAASRIRRELSLQIQTNDIPQVQLHSFKNHQLWKDPYLPDKAQREGKPGEGEENGQALGRLQVLSFDERTMKKARRRQWSEPRLCSRRNLRVDFTDIGWSEWVLAPKAFDAFYCSGSCGFPLPKVLRPSNHAALQSIVRAVGIVPEVPEPCCVPETTSPLPVLSLDPRGDLLLKVYPGMSVDSCSCQ